MTDIKLEIEGENLIEAQLATETEMSQEPSIEGYEAEVGFDHNGEEVHPQRHHRKRP